MSGQHDDGQGDEPDNTRDDLTEDGVHELPDGHQRAKEEVEKLMNLGIEFAEMLLIKYGEFLPFGLSLDADGTPRAVTTYMGEELPARTQHLELIERGFRADAENEEIRACAMFYEVRMRGPAADQSQDAVAVALEHRDNYGATVYFPYTVRKGEAVDFGELAADIREHRVFLDGRPVIH